MTAMERRVYGLETEYGLNLETRGHGLSQLDPGVLFSRLERVLLQRYATLEGDSFGRRPEAARDQIQIREGRFLESGARFYYDTGHVEWATPEAASPEQAVLYDLAGERTLAELAAAAGVPRGGRMLLVKNNVDYGGATTYGCHENYQVERRQGEDDDRFFAAMTAQLVPFLVTRQIFCGAGKLGCSDPRAAAGYQISQRADFIDRTASGDTRGARAIVNTRDEALGDAARWRRLHLILGDANRSPHAAWLKLGTTGLVLRLIEEGVPGRVPDLADPVAALRTVSRDLACAAALPLHGGGSLTAIAVQRLYLERAERFRAGGDPAVGRLLDGWRRDLDDLAGDPMLLADRADWVIKLAHLHGPRLARAETSWREVGAWDLLFSRLRQGAGRVPEVAALTPSQAARHQHLLDRHRLRWADCAAQRRLHFELRELDLRYHDLDPERGIFSLLERAGLVRRGMDPAAVVAAQRQPPAGTRACARAEVIRWAHAQGVAGDVLLDWGRASLPPPAGMVWLDDPLAPASPALTHALAPPGTPAGARAVRPERPHGRDAAEVPIHIIDVEAAPPPPPASGFGALLRSLLGR
jgi:Pup-ligase protein